MDWAEKYRPRHLSELVGNRESLRQMSEWARQWTTETPPLIIYGKPGIGKTSSAWALANDMNWEVVELNASDQRTKGVIEKIAGGSASTGSLSGAFRKLIILDEADNLQGNADRGGARAIAEVIRQAKQPLILIANDLYGLDGTIRNLCTKIQFKALPAKSLVPRLREICSMEGITCALPALNDIAEQASGDIRSAVTMLYASAIGKDKVGEDDVSISSKDSRSTIFDLVAATLGYRQVTSLQDLNMTVDETPDTVLQWIEGNLGVLPDTKKNAAAYQALSRADMYLGYTYKTQYYTLWRYANILMLYGVHDVMKGRPSGYAKIMPPTRWRQMSTAKRQKLMREHLLSQLGISMHMSSASVRNIYLCPVSLLARQFPQSFVKDYSFDADQLNILIHDPDLAKSIVKSIDEEKKSLEKELKKKKKEEEALAKKNRTLKKTEPDIKVQLSSCNETDSALVMIDDNEKESETNVNKDKKSSQSTLFNF
ncbi:replication factor C large subunit [Methanospirillum stamsii]|uniref:Replication factor C large subunit n=1 Tax=Methanospirillum stamsii TaxID=1277351 RepID=A0A2V2NFY5_9EURY|nr:replication factor C large subunit [Methanospirillum stamsii]PWR75278.1 replication factor C large subunit [Methanospirillum stamsii]